MAEHLPSLLRKPTKEDMAEAAQPEGPPEKFFPVGMHISTEEMEAMALNDVEIGEERILTGLVRVKSVMSHESIGGKASKSVSLDMIEGTTAPKPTKTSEEDRAKTLFGGDE